MGRSASSQVRKKYQWYESAVQFLSLLRYRVADSALLPLGWLHSQLLIFLFRVWSSSSTKLSNVLWISFLQTHHGQLAPRWSRTMFCLWCCPCCFELKIEWQSKIRWEGLTWYLSRLSNRFLTILTFNMLKYYYLRLIRKQYLTN
jgi:hypothetical protein